MARRRVSGSGTVVDGREPVGPAALSLPYTRLHAHARTPVVGSLLGRLYVALSSSLSARALVVILSGSGVVYDIIIGRCVFNIYLKVFTIVRRLRRSSFVRNSTVFTRTIAKIHTHVRQFFPKCVLVHLL